MHRVSLTLRNPAPTPLRLIVEPWAREYDFLPGTELEVVAFNDQVVPRLIVNLDGAVTVVWLEDAGSWFELWENGALRDSA